MPEIVMLRFLRGQRRRNQAKRGISPASLPGLHLCAQLANLTVRMGDVHQSDPEQRKEGMFCALLLLVHARPHILEKNPQRMARVRRH
jgi:hypothetical protein